LMCWLIFTWKRVSVPPFNIEWKNSSPMMPPPVITSSCSSSPSSDFCLIHSNKKIMASHE
jgi:hypothetical protein